MTWNDKDIINNEHFAVLLDEKCPNRQNMLKSRAAQQQKGGEPQEHSICDGHRFMTGRKGNKITRENETMTNNLEVCAKNATFVA